MKKNLFYLIFLLGILIASESSAQRYRHHRSYRYSQPRMRLYAAPRFYAPPLLGLGLAIARAGVYIAPPPIYLGRGLGWRHYHRRGMRCNDRCCRRTNEYERGYNRGYNDRDYDSRRYDDRYDRNRSDDRRYDDSRDYDRRRNDDRRYNQNKKDNQPESINTDEDIYEEVENDTY